MSPIIEGDTERGEKRTVKTGALIFWQRVRISIGRNARFNEGTGHDMSTLLLPLPVLSKERRSFRLAIPETFINVFMWAFMSTLPEGRAAGCPAGRFRCKSCDPDHTSGNHAAIYR